MNRPCLDPSDPDCPLSAPNKEKGEVRNSHLIDLKCVNDKTSKRNTLVCGLVAEPGHCRPSPGGLPWFQPQVHALAGGADPGWAGQEQPRCSVEVCNI